MEHTTPDHTVVLPAAATGNVRRNNDGRLVIDLTDPTTGHITQVAIPATHPGDARVTVDALISALVDLDVRLHDAEIAHEWAQEAA